MSISKVRKRDGRIVDFDQQKITDAIHKALVAVDFENGKLAQDLSDEVVNVLSEKYEEEVSVENIQDIVIEVLEKKGYEKVAREYSSYREKKAEIRGLKEKLGIEAEPKLTVNALEVLKKRYLLKNEEGETIETPSELFRRVAKAVSEVDKDYGEDSEESFERFFEMMSKLEFLPNSPTLFNANAPLGQLSACFVLPVEDSLESIFDAVKNTALIEQTGGGVGFDFSNLRPRGDIVKSTKGVASGPVSFMRVFDTVTEVIKAGGKRRGAMMGILKATHPDIEEFITAKSKEGPLSNFNISVSVSDDFMEAVENDEEYQLINPRTNEAVKKLRAQNVWNQIVENAWNTGDPGVLFIDEINRHNPTPEVGLIKGTNPCVTGDTWVTTKKGARQVKDILDEKTEAILNGSPYKSNGFFKTGRKQVYKLVTKEGFEVKTTGDHQFLKAIEITRNRIDKEWTELKSLEEEDKILINDCTNVKPWKGDYSEEEGYLIGLLVGDGTLSQKRAILNCWTTDKGYKEIKKHVEEIIQKLPHRKDFEGWHFREKENKYRLRSTALKKLASELGVNREQKTVTDEIEKTSYDFYKGFLRGLFDSDGSVQGDQSKGFSIRLSQSNLNTLKGVQRMLLRLGVFSKIYKFRREATERKLPDGQRERKPYDVKSQHELIISKENIKKFHEVIGFCHGEKARKLKKLLEQYKRRLNRERFLVEVKKIEPSGVKTVYDANVGNIHSFSANGFIVHNCGEVPLLPNEPCNLGSINVSKMVRKNNGGVEIDWEKLERTVRAAVHFLDNVIDANKYPLPEIEEMAKANRKIGLGIMGWAELLLQLGIPYDSEEALDTADELMGFISEVAREKSVELGKERGSFPNFEKSIWANDFEAMRNATVTSIAPTGSISIIGGCSSSIEPLFSIAFMRNVLEGSRLFEVNPIFERVAKNRGFYSAELMKKIAKKGSIQNIEEIPDDVKNLFVTALDIDPEWHVKMQAAFQKHVDNAVSKTVNLPKDSEPEKISEMYKLAWELNCKGITIYRYGSKKEQVLYVGEPEEEELEFTSAESEYSGGSFTGVCPLCG